MRRKRLILPAALLIAALGGLGWLFLRSPEPVVKGKRLSVWLEAGYNMHAPAHFPLPPHFHPTGSFGPIRFNSPEEQAADEAMRAVGTNAIPTLLRMLRATDSPFKLKMIDLAQTQHFIPIRYVSAEEWNSAAVSGFSQLGHDTRDALPAVVEIYLQNLSPSSRNAALTVMGIIGPSIDSAATKVMPLLLRDLTDPNSRVRQTAMSLLVQIHSEPELVVHKLIPLLNDPDPEIRSNAAYNLGTFGARARPAVPALTEALHSPDTQLQKAAQKALKQIQPEAGAVNLLTPEAALK